MLALTHLASLPLFAVPSMMRAGDVPGKRTSSSPRPDPDGLDPIGG